MRKWLKENGSVLIVVGVLTLAAGLAYRRPSGECLLPTLPAGRGASTSAAGPLSTDTPDGEPPMSTSSETYGQVEHATEATFQQMVLESSEPVLVDFYADWCGPCRALAPVLEELARENPQTRVVKVDVDRAPRLAAEYQVSSIPTVMVFENGRATAQQIGLIGKAKLESMLGL